MAYETGTTASVGYGTGLSPCAPSFFAACGMRRRRSSTGYFAQSPEIRLRCKSCTAFEGSADSPKWNSRGSPATKAPGRSVWETRPSINVSSTSMAKSPWCSTRRVSASMDTVQMRCVLSWASHVTLRPNGSQPDRGIWEMRGPERHFTASKVAAWVAMDRAIRYIEEHHLDEPLEDLRETRQVIFDEVCRKGFSPALNSFTQYYDGTTLDASLLFIPMSGFLPAHDPRVVGTVAALERELLQDGLLLRYRAEIDVDGLTGEEGVFLACTFWLAAVYHMMGRRGDARRLFERAASTRNDLGLLAEEYDTKSRRQLGNFPQAFSHFALVNAAFVLGEGEAVH